MRYPGAPQVEPVAYGLPTLDDLFWNNDLHLFEIKSNSAGLDWYDPVLVRKATKDNAPTWNYLNNKLKASQSLTKKFLDSRRRISECIQEIHKQRPVKDTPAIIQRAASQSQPTTPITSRVTSPEPTRMTAGPSRLTSPLAESNDPATTGDESEQTNEPEPIAEASALEPESDSDSDSDSNDEMTNIAELQAQINCLSGSTKLDVPKPKGFQGKSDDVGPFIQRVEAYFNATGNGQTGPQRKINYAVLLIDSNSDVNYWKDLHYLEEDAVQAQGQHQFNTWEEFKDAFRKAFPVYAEGDKALMTLTRVRQGRTPMTAFIPKFRTLAVKAKITDNAVLAALFKRAVCSDLLGKMLNLENPPSTMAGWYDLVLRLDSRQVYSGGYSGGGEQRSYQNTG
ncbi:hypothetical protein DAEQUDRAFT_770813 [Daedalea quercina L-15889]|uniref:Retrotransposon gag domain-containing protein n=1 Tax=Daedalea quercina L-15889 TaxID=1314783 RepID=A0A165KJ66_9APHY|nr:hypothetical protein DAEQUDRAFT_770813 [Daedalea quercina L-15889]